MSNKRGFDIKTVTELNIRKYPSTLFSLEIEVFIPLFFGKREWVFAPKGGMGIIEEVVRRILP